MKVHTVDIALPVYHGNLDILEESVTQLTETLEKWGDQYTFSVVISINGPDQEKIASLAAALALVMVPMLLAVSTECTSILMAVEVRTSSISASSMLCRTLNSWFLIGTSTKRFCFSRLAANASRSAAANHQVGAQCHVSACGGMGGRCRNA